MMDVFDERNMVLNAAPVGKTEAIRLCGRILQDRGYVQPAYIDDMLAREQLATTYIGNHVAIPHGLSTSGRHILHSGLSLVQVPGGVSFGQDRLVYLLIGIAGKDGEHLGMLEHMVGALTDLEKIAQLRIAGSAQEIITIFQEVAC